MSRISWVKTQTAGAMLSHRKWMDDSIMLYRKRRLIGNPGIAKAITILSEKEEGFKLSLQNF